MASGSDNVIRKVLDRRAAELATSDDATTATVAVMARLLPLPKGLLVFQDSRLRQHTEQRILPNTLDLESVEDEQRAFLRLEADLLPVVLTDRLEFVRKLRARQGARAPFVFYVVTDSTPADRVTGILAGADDCIESCVTHEEFNARLRAARRIAELESVLRLTIAENRKRSATDELTRVASRRFFSNHFPREVERAARYKRPFSLILCDIDFFKRINDTYGHPGGDQILQQFGARLQQFLRRGVDWVARLGGEEFAVVLPETGYTPALDIARKLRDGIGHAAFMVDNRTVRITASFGLCGLDCVPREKKARLARRILKIADTTLYRSKEAGRNRVTATNLSGPS
jgi:two-component system, cell cycle response regulator